MERTKLGPSAAVALSLVLGVMGCGGSSESGDDSAADTPTPSATTVPTYSLDDREEFLATGPDCEALRGWYEQFPADVDGRTALGYIQACNEAPEPVLNGDIFAGSNERMLEALLDPAVSGESRAAAHRAIARGVCSMFSEESGKSLWLVGSTIRDYGGTPSDYRAVIDQAIRQCPSNETDLRLFTTGDVLATTTQFRRALDSAGADLSSFGGGAGADDQIAALAGVACQSARDGEAEGTGFFISTLMDVSEQSGEALATRAIQLYCPEYG